MKIHSTRDHRTSSTPSRLASTQSGLSILEVLIALAVLSIGLAGLAIMHLNSLKYAHSAYYRSIASSMAIDLEERLWLRMADTTAVTDCPDVTSTGLAYSSLTSAWTWGGTGTKIAQINGLNIIFGDVATIESGHSELPANTEIYREIPITFAWNESRFNYRESAEDDALPYDEADFNPSLFDEQFHYKLRVFCRGASTAPAGS